MQVLAFRQGGKEVCACETRRAHLQVRRAGPAQGPAAQQGAAQIGAAATRPADDTARGTFERRVPHVEHAGLMQDAERARTSLDV